jgi:putative acetyltransferase
MFFPAFFVVPRIERRLPLRQYVTSRSWSTQSETSVFNRRRSAKTHDTDDGRTDRSCIMTERLAIRRVRVDDMAAIARLFRTTREACLPYLPELHAPEEDLRFFRERVFRETDMWVAEHPHIVGFISYRTGWVDHLYVHPDFHARGTGSALLSKAMEAHANLQLWVFQKNATAIRFYAARGFRLVEWTDGCGNEECEPDALYAWHRSP